MSAVAARRSTLNPNAPLFIPAAYQQVEDFSPEWWELVKTTAWFRDHWFQQHHEEETFEAEEDVTNLLPDSIDLGFTKDLWNLGSDFTDEAGFFAAYDIIEPDVKSGLGSGNGVESLMRSLSLKSPKNRGAALKTVLEPVKHKPAQSVGPKLSHRRIIHQPR